MIDPDTILIVRGDDATPEEDLAIAAALAGRGLRASTATESELSLAIGASALDPTPLAVLNRAGATMRDNTRRVLRGLELAGTPVVPSLAGTVIAGDKALTKALLMAQGVPVVPGRVGTIAMDAPRLTAGLEGPFVLKTAVGCGTQGDGVHGPYGSTLELQNALFRMRESFPPHHGVLVESCMMPGVDLRVLVFAGRAVAAIERRSAEGGDFRANLSLGGTARRVGLTPEIVGISERATAALGLKVAGVDLFRTRDGAGYVVGEMNSAPGFKHSMKVLGSGPNIAELKADAAAHAAEYGRGERAA